MNWLKKWWKKIGTYVCGWLLGAAIVQERFLPLLGTLAGLGVLIFLVKRWIRVTSRATFSFFVWYAILLGSAGWFLRAYCYGRDLIVVPVSLLLAGTITILWETRVIMSRFSPRLTFTLWPWKLSPMDQDIRPNAVGRNLLLLTLSLAFIWIATSIMDFICTKPLKRSVLRFAELPVSRWSSIHIGLALSGGGYRAALLHAGVVEALESEGIRVTCMSSVSGGSIFASYYALGGSPQQFVDAVKEHRFNLKRALFDAQNASRLVFPAEIPWLKLKLLPFFDYSRTDVQISLLKTSIFGEASELQFNDLPGPAWLICATDLSSGLQAGFCSDGIVFNGTRYGRVVKAAESGLAKVSLPVLTAASGAFPGAFPPVALSIGISNGPNQSLSIPLRLSDGGIVDNLGLQLLEAMHRHIGSNDLESLWHQDVILVSNGSMLVQSASDQGEVSDALRAIDLATSVHSEAEEQRSISSQNSSEMPKIWLSPGRISVSPDAVIDTSFSGISRKSGRRMFWLPIDLKALEKAQLLDKLVSAFSEKEIQSARKELNDFRDAMVKITNGTYLQPIDLVELTNRAVSVLREEFISPTSERIADEADLLRNLEEQIRAAKIRDGGQEGELLKDSLDTQIMFCFEAFQSMPTLQDCPDADTADEVYRLGKFLVYLNLEKITTILNQAKNKRDLRTGAN
jgi:predicted acylesterase/phospholipase RssA